MNERQQLPTNPDVLPPTERATLEALDALLQKAPLPPLSESERAVLSAHLRLLDAWNPFINLTRIENASERASRHLLDALVGVPLIDQLMPHDGALADLGSGGGFPGIPLAARLLHARPRATFDLIEATGKKARFLEAVAAASGLSPRLRVVQARAEELVSASPTRYDVIVARAVAPLAELARLARPLLADGGHLIAWKREGETWSEELATATSLVGPDAIRVHRVSYLGLDRALLVLVSG
ncbi:MAG: 16S rRNA (guanine(527)-N(7))-methyltransferase RsmG [Candidatus Limnocylindrus sp.]